MMRARCRTCPSRAPSGRCLAPGLKSGRCGDYVWYVSGNTQHRRRYVIPKDPRTPEQLLRRARFGAASIKYSRSLTDQERKACIAAGAKLRSRPRLGQWGWLTGQQYLVRKECTLANGQASTRNEEPAVEVQQLQGVTGSTSERYRTTSGAIPWRLGANMHPSPVFNEFRLRRCAWSSQETRGIGVWHRQLAKPERGRDPPQAGSPAARQFRCPVPIPLYRQHHPPEPDGRQREAVIPHSRRRRDLNRLHYPRSFRLLSARASLIHTL